ncbi:hypothetical protein TNCV_1194051 [Trichonephila clavipes]|nr:hypothetical protein TNCV_1194051 [Trichonephila clavipes]
MSLLHGACRCSFIKHFSHSIKISQEGKQLSDASQPNSCNMVLNARKYFILLNEVDKYRKPFKLCVCD